MLVVCFFSVQSITFPFHQSKQFLMNSIYWVDIYSDVSIACFCNFVSYERMGPLFARMGNTSHVVGNLIFFEVSTFWPTGVDLPTPFCLEITLLIYFYTVCPVFMDQKSKRVLNGSHWTTRWSPSLVAMQMLNISVYHYSIIQSKISIDHFLLICFIFPSTQKGSCGTADWELRIA